MSEAENRAAGASSSSAGTSLGVNGEVVFDISSIQGNNSGARLRSGLSPDIGKDVSAPPLACRA